MIFLAWEELNERVHSADVTYMSPVSIHGHTAYLSHLDFVRVAQKSTMQGTRA